MSQILAILRRPHPGYANLYVYFKISTTIAIGVFLILSILQPFNIDNRNIMGNPFLTALVYALGSYVTMLINSIWIKLFPRFFSDEKWTLGKEILMCLYQMICVASTIWLINYVRGTVSHGINSYFDMLIIVISVGSLPYLIVLLIRNIYLMKWKLQKAAKMNIGLMLKNKEAYTEDVPQQINLQSLDNPVDVSLFLSAESKNDYLVVNIAKNGQLEKVTVNTSLEEFEAENSHLDQLFRCHREFIINKNRIIWVEGNAAGYKLILHPDLPAVNVSRDNTEELKKRMKVTKLS